jgi:hypothetical protein
MDMDDSNNISTAASTTVTVGKVISNSGSIMLILIESSASATFPALLLPFSAFRVRLSHLPFAFAYGAITMTADCEE